MTLLNGVLIVFTAVLPSAVLLLLLIKIIGHYTGNSLVFGTFQTRYTQDETELWLSVLYMVGIAVMVVGWMVAVATGLAYFTEYNIFLNSEEILLWTVTFAGSVTGVAATIETAKVRIESMRVMERQASQKHDAA